MEEFYSHYLRILPSRLLPDVFEHFSLNNICFSNGFQEYNRGFILRGLSDLDPILVIFGEHFPKLICIDDILRQVTVLLL
jgi:hypothetical protein